MATYNTGFLDTGPEPSELLKALMSLGNRQNRDPYTGEEAALRTASSLVDAVTQKKIFDDEQKRAKTARTADMAALRAYSGGQAALPEQYIERGTADPLEKYLAPINLDPQVFGTNAPAIDNYSQNVIPQAPTVVSALTNMGATSADLGGRPAVIPQSLTAQDLMGATNVMPETPQNVIPQAPTADQLMGDPMGMALGGEPLPQELTSQQAMQQAMQQQMVEGVGQGFDYNPAQEAVKGFSQEALQLALQGNEISPDMANNLVNMYSEQRRSDLLRGGLTGTAKTRSFDYLTGIISNPNSTPDEVLAAKIALKLEAPTENLEMKDFGGILYWTDPNTGEIIRAVSREEQLDNAKQVKNAQAEGTETGRGKIQRQNKDVENGMEVAAGLPIIRRALQLMETMETGGLASIGLKARQFFGVEGADEGELSANLGVAVLSKLRSTFGAAFTQEEGNRLIDLSASFTRSPEANKALLKQGLLIIEGAIRRGTEAAKELGDQYSINQFQRYNDGDYDLTDERLQSVFNPQPVNPTQPDNDNGNMDYWNPETKGFQKTPYKPTER